MLDSSWPQHVRAKEAMHTFAVNVNMLQHSAQGIFAPQVVACS